MDALTSLGLPAGDLEEVPSSSKRFPDGAHYRVEIPSTEGPDCLRAVIEKSGELGVRVHRVSQGSGVFMHTDDELDEMVALASEAVMEFSIFARPNAAWTRSAMTRAPAGAGASASAWGQAQVSSCLNDITRAAEHGFRSVLIGDIGVLAAFNEMRRLGDVPQDMQAKTSVMLTCANACAARVYEDLGANTINVASDLTLGQLAAVRAAVDVPIDMYVESPDNIGGFVRLHEIPEIIRVAAPVYVKFGLRNAPDIYPAGSHLSATSVALSRERTRRAKLGMELLARSGAVFVTSELGAKGLALPVPRVRA